VLDGITIESADAGDVRDLAAALERQPPTAAATEALETWSRADDADVRVAVCEACANAGTDDAEAILKRLRIDTNDRVTNAAIDAYSG